MNIQQNILTKIQNDTNELIKSHVFPSIQQLVEHKIKEEKEKFFDNTNILGDIFPKPIGTGLFRSCGHCSRCKHRIIDSDFISAHNNIGFTVEGLESDEYILLCTALGKDNEGLFIQEFGRNDPRTGYIKNYQTFNNGRGVYTSNYGSMLWLGMKGHNPVEVQITSKGSYPLTQEFINYYNLYIQLCNSIPNNPNMNNVGNNILSIYQSNNPKASELYKIQKQKENIEKMISELQKKEIEIVKTQSELSEMKKEFEKEKKDFEEQRKIHKQKNRNILKRENDVFMKESIKTVLEELKNISFSLSDLVDLMDDVDPVIEERIIKTITKLNSMFNSDEGLVVVAVEAA